ncbi:MAG TPA: enoyl-CoA hydratase/isomerase family protein [Sphingobium sp.]|nr:enoyl-CoA hydratase/isomerase family protein [Sphingobium sp.]
MEVKLDRSARRNAMTSLMVASLLDLLDGPGVENVGAIVLSGAGKGFCAGSDLAGLSVMSQEQRSDFEVASGLLARRIMACPIPVVAAVHGFAIGGGLTLAAACDIVVADPASKWSLPEVPIGLFPAWGLEAVELRTGRPMARRLSWGLDMLDGVAAQAAGLVDELADDPFSRGLEIAGKLAALPRQQAASVKDYFAVGRTGKDADDHAVRHFTTATHSDEAMETFRRFGSR